MAVHLPVHEGKSTGSRPIYDRHYPELKRFPWLWRAFATYWTFMMWLSTTPWLLMRAIAPEGFQDNLQNVERELLEHSTHLITLIQDLAYMPFAIADSVVDWTINTSQSVYHQNLKGFEHTFDHVLRNIEHRVRILKDEGLNGIPRAMAPELHDRPFQQNGPTFNQQRENPVSNAAERVGNAAERVAQKMSS